MKILHSSDWHLGKALENINRLDEQKQFIDELCELADSEKIDLVLVAGDVFDTYTPSSAAEELFYSAVDRLSGGGSRAVVVIAGNHDSPERLCAASPLAYKNGIILLGYPASDAGRFSADGGRAAVVESGPGWLELKLEGCSCNAIVLTLPYPSEARLDQVITLEQSEEKLQEGYSERVGSLLGDLSRRFREDTVNLIAAHLFIRGGKESESERTLQVGGAMTVDPAVLPQNAHYAALGHLHRPQKVKNSPCPAYYSGSPLAYSFSEADYSKAVYIVEAFPGESAKVREHYLQSGRPLHRWVAKEGIAEALKWCEEGRDQNAWIDLEIFTDKVLAPEEQKLLRELHPGIINIRPRITAEAFETDGGAGRETKKVDELFKDYYRFRTGTDISDELMNTFLDLLNLQEEDTPEEGGGELEAEIS